KKMKQQSIAFCLLLLVIGSQTVLMSEKQTTFKKMRSIITIMSQVQTKLTTNGPINDIADLLFNYFQEIIQEQINHDTLFERQKKECDEEAEYRAKEVKDGQQAHDSAQVTLEHCNSQNNRAERDLSNNLDEQQKTRVYLQNLILTREQQAAKFQEDTQSYKANSAAVDEAISILQEIWSGQSEFIQLSRHVNKMLKHAISMRKVNKIAPLMAAFAQLSAKQLIADEAQLQQVLRLLNQFRQDVENDYRAKEKAEQEAQDAFAESKAATEDYLGHLEQAQKELEEELKELKSCINNQTAISQSAAAKIRRNQDLLDSTSNMCVAFANEYVSAAQGRIEEVELLQVILEKVKLRYEQLSDNVIIRGLQSKFDEYTNKSPYERVDSFVHQQGEFNEKGAAEARYVRNKDLEQL
ncbi:hypothetical protein IMG5_156800, partial [Ichthyophthirius multifiliis]